MLCKTCCGNGEVVIDWPRYLHCQEGDIGDEAVAECEQCSGTGLDGDLFEAWISQLSEDVIEGEFGYEPGEFAVIPEAWEPLYREGLTPQEAFKRALNAAAEARREGEEANRRNWERIQREDALLTDSTN